MPGATMWNGCLTVVGGENAEGVVSTVEICDEVAGVWEEPPPPLRFARSAPTVVADGDLMMVVGGFAVCPPLYKWGQVVAAEQYDLEEGCWKLCGQEQGLCLCHYVVVKTCVGGQNGVAHEVTCMPAEAYVADGHAHLSHHHMRTPTQTPGLDCCPFASVRILPIHPHSSRGPNGG